MTVLAVAAILVLALTPTAPIVAPNVDAQCLGSPIHLATDNIPNSNRTATSIVDMTAFVAPRSGNAVAWVYANRLGQRFLQTNLVERNRLRTALTPSQYARYVRGDPKFGGGSFIQAVGPSEIASVGTALARRHIQSQPCFTGRLTTTHVRR